MPLYELKCTNKKCGHEFEEQIKLVDADAAKCPKCKKPASREFRSNPGHFRHVSWSKWKV